jgi:hypothetical protein
MAFERWRGLASLSAPYPEASTFFNVVRDATPTLREYVVRLWFSEGVPFGFRDTPALYEEIRTWLAARLRISPKDVTIIGSARIGFSLSPGRELGRPFSLHSDLDFSVVSSQLFSETASCFAQWKEDFANGLVRPRRSREARLWPENVLFGDRNIPKGFMDPEKIPTLQRYELPRRVGGAVWALGVKLEASKCGHPRRRTSVRVYRDWASFTQRMMVNLRAALNHPPHDQAAA